MKRISYRLLWTFAIILAGAGIVLTLNVPNVWVSLMLAFIVYTNFGLVFTAAINFTLDLVPSFRGTIMSLLTAAESLGMTFGSSFGGLILLSLTYSSLGFIIGSLGFIAALVVYFWAK